MLDQYLPVLLQILVAGGLAASMLIFSVLLGKTGTPNATKNSPYECGMLPIGEGQPRFSVKFYMVAMLFVLFDIEVVFMYPWAARAAAASAQSNAKRFMALSTVRRREASTLIYHICGAGG